LPKKKVVPLFIVLVQEQAPSTMEAHEVLVQELAGLDRPWRFYSFGEMDCDIFWFHSLPWYLPS